MTQRSLWLPVLTDFPEKHTEFLSNTSKSTELTGRGDTLNSEKVVLYHIAYPIPSTHFGQ